ncbi:MAG TPA: lysylphosphatidylglycerol synthase transmembrane domain-containing protein [Candidatus Binatia bacterium]|nr:lysylphosphatidylglycerol synthase transmembrane domain-containing protein [Candidatus Binatia bacterium]
MKKANPALILLAKVLVSVGLLVFFFTRVPIDRFLHTLASADFSYIGIALIVYLVCQAVSSVRWTLLARPLGFKTPFKDLVEYYFIGMFFNLFAPGTVGGDVSRVYYLSRDQEKRQGKGWSVTTAVLSVFADRAIGMVALVWVGAVGLALFPEYAVPAALRTLTIALAIGFFAAGLLAPLLPRILPQDGHPIVVKVRLALRSYRAHWRAILQAIFCSLGIHLIQSWMHVIMGWALHINIPFSYCLIVYPLVGIFAALPISVNGFGLREGGYLFMLGIIGISAEKGIAFGLLLFLVVALDSLIGGIVFLMKKAPKPSILAVDKN